MEGSTNLGQANFDYQFPIIYQLGILSCDHKWGFATLLGGKMGVKSGKVPAYPLRWRNVAGMMFLTK